MCHFLPQFNFIRPHATLLMTGSHTLAELRDAICCVSDLQVCGEFSNNPDAAPAFISKVPESGVFIAQLKISHLRPVNGVVMWFMVVIFSVLGSLQIGLLLLRRGVL